MSSVLEDAKWVAEWQIQQTDLLVWLETRHSRYAEYAAAYLATLRTRAATYGTAPMTPVQQPGAG
jgi:hypothetical protein